MDVNELHELVVEKRKTMESRNSNNQKQEVDGSDSVQHLKDNLASILDTGSPASGYEEIDWGKEKSETESTIEYNNSEYGANLQNQIEEVEAQLKKTDNIASAFARGGSGGRAGIVYSQTAINANKDRRAQLQTLLDELECEYATWLQENAETEDAGNRFIETRVQLSDEPDFMQQYIDNLDSILSTGRPIGGYEEIDWGMEKAEWEAAGNRYTNDTETAGGSDAVQRLRDDLDAILRTGCPTGGYGDTDPLAAAVAAAILEENKSENKINDSDTQSSAALTETPYQRLIGENGQATLLPETDDRFKLVLPGADLMEFGLYTNAEKNRALSAFADIDSVYQEYASGGSLTYSDKRDINEIQKKLKNDYLDTYDTDSLIYKMAKEYFDGFGDMMTGNKDITQSFTLENPVEAPDSWELKLPGLESILPNDSKADIMIPDAADDGVAESGYSEPSISVQTGLGEGDGHSIYMSSKPPKMENETEPARDFGINDKEKSDLFSMGAAGLAMGDMANLYDEDSFFLSGKEQVENTMKSLANIFAMGDSQIESRCKRHVPALHRGKRGGLQQSRLDGKGDRPRLHTEFRARHHAGRAGIPELQQLRSGGIESRQRV